MPIRVTCQCGASLSVPDAMAGKSGKCPKCGAALKVPQASPTSATTKNAPISVKNAAPKSAHNSAIGEPKKTTAKPASAPATGNAPGSKPKAAEKVKEKLTEKVVAKGALDQLFSDAGLDKQPAQTCPACKVEITPGAAICVACGLNLSTGERLKGFKVAGVEEEQVAKFNNYQLNRAAKSIKKEEAEELELRFVGAPWWVSLAIVFGIITIIIFGVIYVDGLGGDEGTNFKAPARSFEGRVQRQPPQTLLVVVCFLVSSMVVAMATIAIQIKAFQKSWKTGLLTLIPGYVQYYSIVARKNLRSTTKILWIWTIICAVFSVLLIATKAYRVLTG